MTVSSHEDKAHQLEQANQNYQDAIEFLNHELKNKLIAIIGPIKSLMASEPDESKRKKLKGVFDQAKRLESMSDHFLLFSQLKENKIPLNSEEIGDLYNEVITPVVRNLPEDMASSLMESMQKMENRGPIKLHADKHLLKAVFENLFGNALKYGEPGGEIHFDVQVHQDTREFNVRNKGPGVTREDVEKIFEKFYRAKNTTNQNVTGTGIGLYNARRIIEAHGGAIWCETEPGEWINFIFTIPGE